MMEDLFEASNNAIRTLMQQMTPKDYAQIQVRKSTKPDTTLNATSYNMEFDHPRFGHLGAVHGLHLQGDANQGHFTHRPGDTFHVSLASIAPHAQSRPGLARAMMQHLRNELPADVTHVSGYRVTGVRSDRPDSYMKIRLRRCPNCKQPQHESQDDQWLALFA